MFSLNLIIITTIFCWYEYNLNYIMFVNNMLLLLSEDN